MKTGWYIVFCLTPPRFQNFRNWSPAHYDHGYHNPDRKKLRSIFLTTKLQTTSAHAHQRKFRRYAVLVALQQLHKKHQRKKMLNIGHAKQMQLQQKKQVKS